MSILVGYWIGVWMIGTVVIGFSREDLDVRGPRWCGFSLLVLLASIVQAFTFTVAGIM